MKKKLWIVLTVICLLFAFCACEKKPDEPSGTVPVATDPAETEPAETEPAETEPAETEPAETEPAEEQPDLLDFADGDAMRKFLCGAWEYADPESGALRVSVELREDGGFSALRYREDGEPAEYAGTWELDRFYAGAYDLPDWLRFSAEVSENDMGLFGDFILAARTVCDGRVMLYWMQINNGDSVFSFYYDEYAPVLSREDPAAQAVGEAQRDAQFAARFWKLSEDGTTVWLDDLASAEGPDNGGRFEAVPYRVAEAARAGFDPETLKAGDSFVEVRTDSAGEITELRLAEIRYESFYE
ncbi:MAG: hypothetical protein K6G90_12530 [Clostridia bacterium]|nr:hypothetical protein [Clostridia bacterium]